MASFRAFVVNAATSAYTTLTSFLASLSITGGGSQVTTTLDVEILGAVTANSVSATMFIGGSSGFSVDVGSVGGGIVPAFSATGAVSGNGAVTLRVSNTSAAGFTTVRTTNSSGSYLEQAVSGSGYGGYGALIAGQGSFFYSNVPGPMVWMTDNAAGYFRWAPGGNTERMRLHASGGLSIGNTTDPGVGNLSIGAGSAITSSGPGGALTAAAFSAVKIYRALVTQVGSADPNATVLENGLGGPVVWSRAAQGSYEGTLAGAFPLAKTFPRATIVNNGRITFLRTSDNVAHLVTQDDSSNDQDTLLTNTPIEIIVYP